MWERYNEVYQLNARVLLHGHCCGRTSDGVDGCWTTNAIAYRDFVLVDESHNFRHPDTQRYRVLAELPGELATGAACCSRPRRATRSAWDIYHQMRLFLPATLPTCP